MLRGPSVLKGIKWRPVGMQYPESGAQRLNRGQERFKKKKKKTKGESGNPRSYLLFSNQCCAQEV